MKAESRQIPQKLAARLKFVYCALCMWGMDTVPSSHRALEAFHIRYLQTILHVHWWDKIPHVEIRRRTGTTSLEMILFRGQLRWLGHVTRMLGNRLPRRLLYSELSCGRPSVGGQKKRFKDHINSSLSKCGIPFDRLEELAGDWEEWRAVCDKGLATFEQQHIDVAVAKHADTNSATNHLQQRGRDPPVQYVAVFAPQPMD